MRPQRQILAESERERDARELAGRLTPPIRGRDACLTAAARLEQLLRTRGLIDDPRIPSALIGRLRTGQTPLVHHVLVLNELTRIGLYECLRLVGYDLEDLPLLQAVLHRDRTVVVPIAAYDGRRRLIWPAAFDEHADLARGEFVPELVTRFESFSAAEIDGAAASRFLYLRVGRFDTTLLPAMMPGTIAQVDTLDRGPMRFMPRGPRRDRRSVYAVAHLRGLTCGYIDWLDDRRIVLVPSHHHSPPTIYRLDDEAIVLGRVCAELRPTNVMAQAVSRRGHDHCASRLTRPDPEHQTFGTFLRSSRDAIGMTHRDAHAMSLRIADAYGDRRFAVGVGTLSDWESQRELPLSVPHVLSLAACCSVSFADLLRAGRLQPADRAASERATSRMSLDHMGLGTITPALLPAARIAAGLPDLSWDDVFRCGDGGTVFDRTLEGARYVIVNRRTRRLARGGLHATVDRPLYVLSDECGRQICAGCFTDGAHLYIQPDPHLPLSIRMVPRDRVTIRGRVAAIFRCR